MPCHSAGGDDIEFYVVAFADLGDREKGYQVPFLPFSISYMVDKGSKFNFFTCSCPGFSGAFSDSLACENELVPPRLALLGRLIDAHLIILSLSTASWAARILFRFSRYLRWFFALRSW